MLFASADQGQLHNAMHALPRNSPTLTRPAYDTKNIVVVGFFEQGFTVPTLNFPPIIKEHA